MKVVFNKTMTGVKIKALLLQSVEKKEKLNISKKTLSLYESGNKIPSIKNLIKLCNYYNCSIDDVLCYELEQ